MQREDGSIRSANTPIWDNRYQIQDFGLYRGVVRKVIYTDDEDNDSGRSSKAGKPNEVLYSVMIIGGTRDGQIFNNARLIRSLGGFSNYEEVILKGLEGISKADPTTVLGQFDPSIRNIPTFNGDVVYIQFLNGDVHIPVIMGLGPHQAAKPEASESDGQRFRRKFNGINAEISKDGEFTWAKDNGLHVPIAPNPDDLTYPFINQFAPLPSQEEAVKFTLGNKYDLSLDYSTGLNVTIDGLKDEFSFTTAAGANYELNGLSDSHALDTTVGTAYKLSGLSDSHEFSTAIGANLKIDGVSDSLDLKTTGGSSLEVSGISGVLAKDAIGAKLTLSTGEAKLQSVGGAKLDLNPAGLIKFGNATGDVLQLLGELLQTLAIETPPGFGGPMAQAAKYLELMIKLKLISG